MPGIGSRATLTAMAMPGNLPADTIFPFLASALATGAIVFLSPRLGALVHDNQSGPQKFHDYPVARIGGLGILVGLAVTLDGAWRSGAGLGTAWTLLACSLPALVVGLLEDVTKRVGVALRLGATMLSAAAAWFALDAGLVRLDVAFLDWLLAFPLFAFVITLVAVAGIANAVNIIDGYNGLSGAITLAVLASLAIVAARVGDVELVALSVTLAMAVAGFFVWNFPRGKIFLGDGGAYAVGFLIAEIAVLLVARHPQVSPWFPLVLLAYPAWETLFSIYRKKYHRGHSPGQPDGLHLHMLVYKRLVRWRPFSQVTADKVLRNSLTSVYLWVMIPLTCLPALLYWDNSLVLAVYAFAFGFGYNFLYTAMVRFKVPGIFVIRSQAERDRATERETLKGG